jgi:hypothetical protein
MDDRGAHTLDVFGCDRTAVETQDSCNAAHVMEKLGRA